MSLYYGVAVLLPLFTVAVAIPMALGRVPPNRYYGFRTPKTLSSPRIWYPANRVSGWCMIVGGVAALMVNAALRALYPDWPLPRLIYWSATSSGLLAGLAIIPAFLYLRRL